METILEGTIWKQFRRTLKSLLWHGAFLEIMYIKIYGVQLWEKNCIVIRELDNSRDPYTVTIVKSGASVGHIPPKSISNLLIFYTKRRNYKLSSYRIEEVFRRHIPR